MVFAIVMLLSALSISAVAAWFSITGLVAIFPLFPISIVIMGAVLEVGKLVTASWLYRNWKIAPKLLKSYLVSAVIVLMFITSMGIFGYLSKMHIEQNAPVANNQLKVERIDQRIAVEEKKISDAQLVIAQLDEAVQVLIDYDRIRGPEGSLATRSKQKEERAQLNEIIDSAQERIDELSDKKFELVAEVKQLEVEVGPIKYIAEVVYEDGEKENLEKAVRAVILILIFVFDPLAVVMLVAANMSLVQAGLKKKREDTPNPLEQKIANEVDDVLKAVKVVEEKLNTKKQPDQKESETHIAQKKQHIEKEQKVEQQETHDEVAHKKEEGFLKVREITPPKKD